jgi:hypothetical protein
MSSVSAKYNPVYIVLLLILSGYTGLYGDVRLGVGTGILSYPSEFDPFQCMDRLPLLYPQGEIGFSITDRLHVAVTLSHVKMYGVLDRYVDTVQSMTLHTGGFCVEYDLFSGTDLFGVGAQLQSVIGAFRFADIGEYENGLGYKVYGVARQPLLKMISLGVRTGFQHVAIRARSFYIDEEIILDSFTVDVSLYITL